MTAAILAGYIVTLDGLQRKTRLRHLAPQRGADFTSNDFLALAGAPRLKAAIAAAMERGIPVGAGGSRLLRGNHPEHEALETEAAIGCAFNIGSGRPVTIREVATLLADTLGVPIEPEITGECRIGDVRHCFPDISAARSVLGYQPQTQLEAGLVELVGWLKGRVAVDRVGEARAALAARGLTL